MKRPPSALTGSLALVLTAAPISAQLGRIEFPTSARAPDVQEAFLEGMLLLHSFEYEDAREAFQRARRAEPDFAMAYWGEALTYHHPIWRREEPDEARAVLAELGDTPAARRAKCGTELEARWLRCVEALFGEGTRNERWTAYRDRMARLHAAYPHDVEIGALYSLSILGTSFGRRDARIYMRAAGVAQPFYCRYPDHPGVLHYLIHCYDDPIHAPLGLEMARRYDKVAPDAGHALHMPSHIYVALGMWEDSIRSNEASFAAGDRRRARKGLGVDGRNWHACQWLAYSYLQRGRIADAAKLLDEVWRDHGESRSRRLRFHVIVMRAAHVVEEADWRSDYATLEVDYEGLHKSTVAADRFVRSMAALARDDADAARAQLAAVRALAPAELDLGSLTTGPASCCAPSGQRSETAEDQLAARVVGHEIEAAIAAAAGNYDAALAQLQEACRVEDAMELDFGPPVVVKPAHEMHGELLLQLGKPDEAVPEFEAALVRAPRRARSMLGLARACLRTGDDARAAALYRELAELWRDADGETRGLDEVRRQAE